jgi:hypothetical protein
MSGVRRALPSALGLFAALLVASVVGSFAAQPTFVATEAVAAQQGRALRLEHFGIRGDIQHFGFQLAESSDEVDDHDNCGAVVEVAALPSVCSSAALYRHASTLRARSLVLHLAPKTSPPRA